MWHSYHLYYIIKVSYMLQCSGNYGSSSYTKTQLNQLHNHFPLSEI